MSTDKDDSASREGAASPKDDFTDESRVDTAVASMQNDPAKLVLTEEEKQKRKGAADRVIRHHVYVAMGLGAVPIPLFNLVTLGANQVVMLERVAAQYGYHYTTDVLKNLIATVAGPFVSDFSGGFLSTVLGRIPYVGTAVGVATRPVVNGIVTYALGQMLSCHLRNLDTGKGYIAVNSEAFTKLFKKYCDEAGDYITGILRSRYKDATPAAVSEGQSGS